MINNIKIPFAAINRENNFIRKKILTSIDKCITNNMFILGPEVVEFENKFARYCGVRYAVGVGNGNHALKISLKALGIGSGDEVIVPANSFIASALAVSEVGAIPIFCRLPK